MWRREYDTQDRLVRQSRLVERGSLDDGARLAAIPALQDVAYPGMIRLITGYAYDILGNRIKDIHPLAYAYEETDTANRDMYTVRYAYDALNRPVGETRKHQGADVQVRYGYDANGNRISAENERGVVTSYAYDARNRVESMTDGEGQTFRYVYDAAGNKLQDTNAKGYSMSYRYDGLNRLVEVIDPYGAAVTRYAYDENGNMVKKMDAMGILSGATDEARDGWVYEYDLANRLVKETDPELAAFHDPTWFSAAYLYNPAGELVEQTDALGHVTRYAYNQEGLLLSVTDPLQVTTAYSYDRAGNKRTMTDGRGKTVSYGYGSYGILLEAVNAAGRRETYRYDLALQAAVVQDGNGYHTRYGYDNRGRMLSKRVTETGDEITFTYDEAGNRLTMTDESGASQYAYDRNNRLVRVEKDGVEQLAYTYDAIGNVDSVTDRLDHTTRYGYDKSSRMETVEADGKTTTYRYDANGNREAVSYPGGVAETYVYDKAYRLLSVMNQQQDGSVISQYAYTYDENGQQISKTDSYGQTDYTYDAAGRITRVEAPGKTTAYAYDAAGNRQSLQETYTSDQPSGYTEPNSGVETAYRIRKSEYLYAKDNRLQKLIERMQDAAGKDVLEKTTEYLYDGNGNELRQKVVYLHPHTRSLWQSTGGSLYGEGVNQVSGEGGAGAAAGEATNTDAGSGEAVNADSGAATEEAEASVENGAKPGADAGTPSGADAANVDTAMSPNAVIEKVSNTFDGFNRLKKSERVKDGEQVSIGFIYDGDGLRTRKTVRSSAEGYMEQTTNYLYDRQYVVLETDSTGAMSTRYVRGINYISRTSAGGQTGTAQAGQDGAAANGETALTAAAAQTSYFLYNGHGDVVQTVSEDGTVENQYDYDIFGNPTLTIELYASAIRYAGEFYDAESGLYYLRARYYNPYIGRFISEDSYWGEDDRPLSLNRYTYVLNSPLMYWDPTGHWEEGDEKLLNKEDQAKIIALTSAYYTARNDAERAQAQEAAQEIRTNAMQSRSYDKNADSVLKVEASQTIQYVVGNAIAYNGEDFSKEKWDAVLSSANSKAEEYAESHDSTYVRIDYAISESEGQLQTITSIGRTDLTVTVGTKAGETTPTAAKIDKEYANTANEELFVGQVLANTDSSIGLEKAMLLLVTMEQNGGTISDANLEGIFGKEEFVKRDEWWKFWNWATGDVLELTYHTSMTMGRSIADIDAELSSQRIQEAFGAVAMSGLGGSKATVRTFRNEVTATGGAKTYREATKKEYGLPQKLGASKGTNKALIDCNCFVAGTQVQTDEGEKDIEDIEVGDRVLAKDELNPDGELAYKEVTGLYRNQRDDIIKLYVGEQVIETTDNHPFWVEGKGWVFADELQAGDKLQKADGSNLTIDRVEFIKLNGPVTVYNFTVADFHTYYVTDIGIWVHNTKCFDAAGFEKRISSMNVNERVGTVRTTAGDVASQRGWTKDSKLTRINGRDVYYESSSGNYYALDTQHGRFEVVNKRGKHQGEVNFNLDPTKAADTKGGHDLIMK